MAHLHVHAQETGGVPVLLSAKSVTALGAIINLETGHGIFRNRDSETVVQLRRRPTGRLWMDLFEQMPVVSNNPVSLSGHEQPGANVGLMLPNPKAHVLAAHNDTCADSRRTSPSGQTHETDIPTRRRCHGRELMLRKLYR